MVAYPGACDTSAVVYHETFWVVAGTAAPIIALAAVVSIGQVPKEVLKAAPLKTPAARWKFAAWLVTYACNAADLLLMLSVLRDSLNSLARHADVTSLAGTITKINDGRVLLMVAAVAPPTAAIVSDIPEVIPPDASSAGTSSSQADEDSAPE